MDKELKKILTGNEWLITPQEAKEYLNPVPGTSLPTVEDMLKTIIHLWECIMEEEGRWKDQL